jgi:hypothetical protein
MSHPGCEQLRALLEQRGSDSDVAAHLSTCTTCRTEEAELSAVLARYCRTLPEPLADDLEDRLLDRLYGRLHRA